MPDLEWPIEDSPLPLREAMVGWAARIALCWALRSVLADLVAGEL